MSNETIPDWTAHAVLPPIDVLDPTSPSRSPYRVTLTDFVLRFATSPARCEIIDGLLKYRAALHEAGLTDGFQWIDGSFLENIEQLEDRPPKDIDVVTFYRLPTDVTQDSVLSENPELFDHDAVKTAFRVDSFHQDLQAPAKDLVWWSAYWYGVWSHRRNYDWKGFIEVDLDGGPDDDAAQALADQIKAGETS